MSRIKNRLRPKRALLIHVLIGVCFFYFIIHPLTMVIYWFELNRVPFSFNQFLTIAPERILHSFSFHMTGMSLAFILIGVGVGLGSGLYYSNILKQTILLQRQGDQLKKNVLTLIKEGEGDKVEFKSSLRYDYNHNNVNKGLEEVVVKTITGFMNSDGGELLIGVDDQGNILGLEQDYLSLKKKNRDGFELRIYQLITNHIGIEFCSLVQTDFYELNGKDICALSIDTSSAPAYVHFNNCTAYYIRAGNSTKPLSIQEAVKNIKLRQGKSWVV